MKAKELEQELLDILPRGAKLDPRTMENMAQFIGDYLSSQMIALIEKYPHRETIIRQCYEFVQVDLSQENLLEW